MNFDVNTYVEQIRDGVIVPGAANSQCKKLRADAAEAIKRGRALVDKPGNWTGRDSRRAERLQNEANQAIEAAQTIEAVLNEGNGRKVAAQSGDARELLCNVNRDRRFSQSAPKSFNAMFGGATDDLKWNSVGEFVSALASGLHDMRFVAAAKSNSGESGGYVVPELFVSDIFDRSLEMEIVRPRARVYPMELGGSLSVSGLDLEDHTGGVLGGLAGEWLGQLGAGTNQTPKFRRVTFEPRKLMIFLEASHELDADSPTFDEDLQTQMSKSTAFNLDTAFFTGDGVAKPKGILNADATIAVPKIASQQADTIVYRNVVDMAARLTPGAWNSAVWVASQTTLPQLLTLQFQQRLDTGALIADQAVSAPIFQINGDGTYALLGRPLLLTEKLPLLGDKGDLLLADFSAYGVALRSDMAIEKSFHTGWQRDAVSFRIRIRVDGQPLVKGPTTPVNGQPTSPFIVLEERA